MDLEEMYFKDENGKLLSRVNGTQSIVLAQKN